MVFNEIICYNTHNRTQEAKMSKVNWTDEQKQAIYEDGSNILVAAR